MPVPMFKKWLELAPFVSALLLMFVCGYLLGRLITKRSVPLAPFVQGDFGRPPIPTVKLEGVYNGELKGAMIGEARLFLGGKQVTTDASGAFLVSATGLLTNHVSITVPPDMRFVASRKGKKYYPVDSAAAENLAPTNRVYFKTEEEARGAGYTR